MSTTTFNVLIHYNEIWFADIFIKGKMATTNEACRKLSK